MKKHSEKNPGWKDQRTKIIGLGEASLRKNYYPELREKIRELETKNEELGAAYEELTSTEEELRENYEELSNREHELRENEEKYRNLVENSFDGVLIHQDARIVFMNQTAIRLFRIADSSTIVGRAILSFTHPDYRTIVTERAARGQTSVQEPIVEKFLRDDGSAFDVEVVAVPTKWNGAAAVQVAFRDITERRRGEEALQTLNRELQLILQSMINAFVIFESVFDENGRYVSFRFGFFNDSYARIAHLKLEEVRGRDVFEVWPGTEPGWLDAYREVALTGIPKTFEMYHAPTKGYYHCNAYRPQDTPDRICVIFDDITERKQAEEALSESEHRYRTLVETTDTGFVIVDPDGRVVDANQKYVQLSGHRELAEIVGRNVAEWTAGYEQERNLKAVEQCRKDGVIRNFEVDYADAAGRITPIEINATVVPFGDTIQILTLCRDISGRRKNEQALKESETFYRTVFNTTGSGTIIVGSDAVIIRANEGFARLSGYTVGEIEGQHKWTEFVVPEDLARLQQYHKNRREDAGGAPTVYEFRFQDRYGTARHCINHVSMIPGTMQSVTSIVDIDDRVRAQEELEAKNKELLAAYGDLTAREEELRANFEELSRTERELREAKTHLQAIYDGSPDMIMVHAADGHLIDANENTLDAFGLTREEILHTDPLKMCGRGHTPEMAMAFMTTALESGRADLDWVARRMNGGEFPLDVRIRRIENAKEDGSTEYRILTFARDITERRMAEKALELSRKKLALLNTIIFQDIQSTIFALSAYLQLAAGNREEAKAKSFAEKEAFLIHKIVSSLDFARNYQDMGMHPPRWQTVTPVFLYAISHLDSLKVSRKIQVDDLEVYADPLLEKVFFNLIENVFLHGQQATEISLNYEETEDGLRLILADNGVGIPADEKTKIFERGYGKNTGLGLFLVREILSITSISIIENGIYGQGGRFEILIPKGVFRFSGMNPPAPAP
jgi:PAS domain S-box-containing protein